MKKFILFLSIGLSIISCSSNPKLNPYKTYISDAQLEALSTKQYEESFDILHKSIYNVYVKKNYDIEIKEESGLNIIIATAWTYSGNYEELFFYLDKLNPNLVEVKLISRLNRDRIKNVANIESYETVWREIDLEIERLKAYNK